MADPICGGVVDGVAVGFLEVVLDMRLGIANVLVMLGLVLEIDELLRLVY